MSARHCIHCENSTLALGIEVLVIEAPNHLDSILIWISGGSNLLLVVWK